MLRVKGLLNFEGEPNPPIIQAVQHVLAPPQDVQISNDPSVGLVFISRGIDKNDVERAQKILTAADPEDIPIKRD